MSSSFVYSLLIAFSLLLVTNALHDRICPIERIFQFGDSLSDTGNSILLNSAFVAARLPYGQTFPDGPTGRWSDGRLIIDYIAEAFGLPLLKPYLGKGASFENGVNFAVAGATALNTSFFDQRSIQILNTTVPLNVQLTWFQTYLNSTWDSQIECARMVRRSLVVVGSIAGSDLNYPLTQGRPIEEIKKYLPHIVQNISNGVREVYRRGAVNIVVPGIFPIGCWPFYLTVFATGNSSNYDQFGCLRDINQLATSYNNILQQNLNSLRRELPGASIIYSDFYNAFQTILVPRRFDSRALQACCGTGGRYSFDVNSQCGASGVPVCPNPDQYIHWDGIHLTQGAYRRIATLLIPNIISRLKCF